MCRVGAAVPMLMVFLGTVSVALADEEEAVVVNQNDITISENQVEQWIFRTSNGNSTARERLQDALQTQINLVATSTGLNDEQRRRLEIAGKGDIARFYGTVELLKRKYPGGTLSQEKFNQMWTDIQPLTNRLSAGLHGRRSLFEKVLPVILDESQWGTYSAEIQARQARHYRAKIEAAVVILDQRVPMTDDQRKRFVSVALEKSTPPAVFGQNDFYVILWKMSQLPETDLKPIFDEKEWKVLSAQFDQVRQMRGWIEQQEAGLDDDPDKPVAAGQIAF